MAATPPRSARTGSTCGASSACELWQSQSRWKNLSSPWNRTLRTISNTSIRKQERFTASTTLRAAEEGEEPRFLPDWQKPEWEAAKIKVETDRFLHLPTQFDIHEWQIMADFANEVESDRVRNDL